jgi:hypothetical protein
MIKLISARALLKLRSKTLLFISAVLLTTSANAATIEGKLNGAHCALEGDTCPIDRLDPHIALEQDFVVQQPNGDYYFIINLDRGVKARYVLEDVKVTGEVNEKYSSIQAQELAIKREGDYKTVWSEEQQRREYRDLKQLGASRP